MPLAVHNLLIVTFVTFTVAALTYSIAAFPYPKE